MPAYQFLGISESITPHGTYKQADALIHGRDGEKTTFNDKLFENVEVGAHFTWDYSKRYPDSGVRIITEEEIPLILKQDEENAKAAQEAYEKKKAENIATGRFTYFYTEFRGGKAENIIEFLSDNHEEFAEVLVDVLNEGSRMCGKPKEVKVTVEKMKNDERFAEFLAKAQPGDKLSWYSWNGGFLAYSAGPYLSRNDEMVASLAWIVS